MGHNSWFKFGAALGLSTCLSLAYAGSATDDIKLDFTSYIRTNPEYSMIMLNENTTRINDKQLFLLQSRQANTIEDGYFYVGSRLIVLADYQNSNVDSKFGWLMRHPTSANQIGDNVSEAVVHSVQLGLTGNILPWMTMYANFLYDPEQSFGAGTITALGRNQIQVRKAYALLGDLDQAPFYFTIGKFESPFGLTDSVDPFTSSTVWHAFAGLSYGAKLSFYSNGFHLSGELAQGGAQFRAMNTPVENTAVPSRLNNYVLDGNYELPFNENSSAMLGASYVRGSAYCQGFPVVHFTPCDSANPAYDVYGRLVLNRLTIQGEFAKTTDEWPGTFNPTPPLDEFSAHKVTSFDVGLKYSAHVGERDYDLSGSFSRFEAGPDGAPWHRQDQIVIGLATEVKTVKFFGEYIRVNGFAPLNFISGSLPDQPFPAGTTHSQDDVHNNIFMVGLEATV